MAGPYTQLDANQVIKHAFDEANDRLRVDATVTASISDVAIADPVTGNTLVVNADGSINVDIVNPVEVQIDAATDSIAIGQGSNRLTVNADGTANVRMSNALVTAPYDYVGLVNTVIAGQTVVSTATYKLGGVSGTIVAILTLGYDLSANLTSVTKS